MKEKDMIEKLYEINLETMETQEVTSSFEENRKYKHNGQHFQFPGHALVRIRFYEDGVLGINFWHPDTGPETGHVDMIILVWNDGRGLEISTYRHEQLQDERDVERVWPSGFSNFLLVLARVSQELEKFGLEKLKISLLDRLLAKKAELV